MVTGLSHDCQLLGSHMTARELWVKRRPPLASLLSKLQPDQTFYGRDMESQARVSPVPALFIINSAIEGLRYKEQDNV